MAQFWFGIRWSDIQEIGSQTRKTYKGLESWAMGTLDFFPNQFGGFQMCIPLKGHWTSITFILSISNSIEDFKLNLNQNF